MTFNDILAAAKNAGSFATWGVSKLIAPKVGDPQEALLANRPNAAPGISPSIVNQLGVNVQAPLQDNSFSGIIKNVLGATNRQPSPSPSPSVMPLKPTMTPTPSPTQPNNYQRAIEEGFKNWGSPPAATLSGEMASYVDKYPIFKQYPFLLPALTVLETGGGAKNKKPNNWTNWGIYQDDYNPSSPQYNLERTASGLANRSPYYKDFRTSQALEDLAKVYAPSSDNPGTGGNQYAKNLRRVMEVFASKM